MKKSPRLVLPRIAVLTSIVCFAAPTQAQQRTEHSPRDGAAPSAQPSAPANSSASIQAEPPNLTVRERYLLTRIQQLEQRLAELEAQVGKKPTADPVPLGTIAHVSSAAGEAVASSTAPSRENEGAANFLPGTTLNLTLDGYYGYNFNRPVGRINLLRAYDVLTNSFSLNQAAVILERTPDLPTGRRIGLRLDLQYGQATATLQGSAANEPRPQVYRPIFQAYGTYVVPLGTGLTVDFGKWASPLGIENNYTKDQINYSRSFFYNFLPFYHFGVRTNYTVGPLVLNYWVVNGANQSEDFNGFKSQAVALTWKPATAASWTVIYYTGKEGRDLSLLLNPGLPTLPTQPGLSAEPVTPAPRGRLHILDSYATWKATRQWTVAGELDYAVNRVQPSSAPRHVVGGAAYAQYRFTPKFALAGRMEYLSDRGGLLSGVTQALKETTLTADYNLAQGFLVRTEWRRDFSNQPFFLTEIPGVLKREQSTATAGLIWWLGGKQGVW